METVKYLESLSDTERINLFERVYMQSKKMYYSLLACWYTGNMDDGINDRINAKLLAENKSTVTGPLNAEYQIEY